MDPEKRGWDTFLLVSTIAIMATLPLVGIAGLLLVFLELGLVEGVLIILHDWKLLKGRGILLLFGNLIALMVLTPVVVSDPSLVVLFELSLVAVVLLSTRLEFRNYLRSLK